MTGAELREWRKKNRVSRVLLADTLGRTSRTLSAYESTELPIPRHIELACMQLGYPDSFTDPGHPASVSGAPSA